MRSALSISCCFGLLALLGSGAAQAACFINGLAPTDTVPTTSSGGQTFTFVATTDCTTLRFSAQDRTVMKTPVRGMLLLPGVHRYSVTLTPSEWESLVGPFETTLDWRIVGTDATGGSINRQVRNEIDVDGDGWLRTNGDFGDCDSDPAQHPGATEVPANGIDENCDGAIDNVVLSDPDVTVTSMSASEYLGWRIASGDVDADGTADLVLASPDAISHGVIYVAHGPMVGDVDAGDLVAITPQRDMRFGESLAVGDVNGDGVDDILSGWVGDSNLFLGPIERRAGPPDVVYRGMPNSEAGQDVDIVPDLDGDTMPDIVIGNPEGPPDSNGRVYVLSGTTSGNVSVETSATHTFVGADHEYVGSDTFSIGDATGDGISDLAIGAPHANLATLVYLVEGGGPGGTYDLASTAFATVLPIEDNNDIGVAVAGGDLDGDGTNDVLVGDVQAYVGGSDVTGVVYGLLGPLSGSIHAVDAPSIWFGSDDAGLGDEIVVDDLDGDTQLDVLLGARAAHVGGAVYVQLGWTEGVTDVATLPTLVSPAVDAGYGQFGSAIATVPDWTGDDRPEIAVGMPAAFSDNRGEAYVFFSDSFFP